MTDTPADRLRRARLAKGFVKAVDAARAFGWHEGTYTSHENGHRGLRQDAAKRYAAAFGVSAGYLLGIAPGRGDAPQREADRCPIAGEARLGAWIETTHKYKRIQSDTFTAWDFMLNEAQDLGFLVESVPVVSTSLGGSMPIAIRVLDDSVNNKFSPGEFAIVEPVKSFESLPSETLVYIRRQKNGLSEFTIRKFVRLNGAQKLTCDSKSERYKDVIEITDDVIVIGEVVGRYERF